MRNETVDKSIAISIIYFQIDKQSDYQKFNSYTLNEQYT